MGGVTRKQYLVGTGAVLGGLLAAACGRRAGAPGEAGSPAASTATGKVVFLSPANQRTLAKREPQYKAFQTRYPRLTIDHIWPDMQGDKIAALIVAGTPPDVAVGDYPSIPNFAERGWMRNLTPWVKRDKMDLEDFFEGVRSKWFYKGNQYAFTEEWGTQFLYLNRDLYRRAGLALPNESTTYQQFLETAKKLTRASEADPLWGTVARTWWVSVIDTVWSWGGEMFDKDSTRCILDSPEATEAVQWHADVWLKHLASPTPAFQSQQGQNHTQLFNTGKAASILSTGLWEADTYSKTEALDWHVVALPRGPKGRANFIHAGIIYVVGTKETPNPEGGWTWVSYVNSQEGYKAAGGPPEDGPSPRKSLADWIAKTKAPSWWQDRGVNEMHRVSAPTLHGVQSHVNFNAVRAEIEKAWRPIWTGEMSAKQAMAAAVPAINALMAKGLAG